jgi:hypothetical protein
MVGVITDVRYHDSDRMIHFGPILPKDNLSPKIIISVFEIALM